MTELKKLHASALRSSEYIRREWHCIVPTDTTVEDMLRIEFWSHVAAQLREHDIIVAVTEDKSVYCEFYVRWSRRLEASVSLLRRVELERAEVGAEVESGYEIKFRGQRSRWTILRGKDVVKDGFETENQARAYLSDHLKQLAA